MAKEIFAKYDNLRITDDNKLAFKVQAELLDYDNDGFAVPGVKFTIKSISTETHGKADRLTGIFESDEIIVNLTTIDSETCEFSVDITALDDCEKIQTQILIEVRSIIRELHTKLRSEAELQKNETAQRIEEERAKVAAEAKVKREQREKFQKLLNVIKDGFAYEAEKREAWKHLSDYANHEYLRDFFLQATDGNSLCGALSNLIKANWYNELLRKLSENMPDFILGKFKLYEDHSRAHQTVEAAAVRDPISFFKNIELYEFYPWTEQISLNVATRAPKAALDNFDRYKLRPWANSVKAIAEKSLKK